MSEYGRQTGHDTIEFERRLGASRQVVWDHLVNPDRRSSWFCGGSTGEQTGEEIVLDFDHRRLSEMAPPDKYAEEQQATHRGEIVAFEPDERLQFKRF